MKVDIKNSSWGIILLGICHSEQSNTSFSEQMNNVARCEGKFSLQDIQMEMFKGFHIFMFYFLEFEK